MESRLNHKKSEIYKLQIVKVIKSGLIVKQLDGKEGFVHISEVSDSYILNLKEMYEPSMYVFGIFLKREGDKNLFSLKSGHTIPVDLRNRHRIKETNGGYLSIVYNLDKFLKN